VAHFVDKLCLLIGVYERRLTEGCENLCTMLVVCQHPEWFYIFTMLHVELLVLPGTSAEPKSRRQDHDRPRAKITKLVSAFLPIIARMIQEVRISEEKIILNNSLMVIILHDRPSIFVRMKFLGPQDPDDHLTQVIIFMTDTLDRHECILVGPHRLPYSLNTGSSLTVSPFHRETPSQRTREIIHAFKCFAVATDDHLVDKAVTLPFRLSINRREKKMEKKRKETYCFFFSQQMLVCRPSYFKR
jgi:hypothetical protein